MCRKIISQQFAGTCLQLFLVFVHTLNRGVTATININIIGFVFIIIHCYNFVSFSILKFKLLYRYYGDYQMFSPVLFIKDAQLIKSIMIKNFNCFMDRRSFVNSEVDPIFSKSLFALPGLRNL